MMSLIWWMASLPAAQKGFSELNWVDSPNTYLEGPNGVVAPVQWDITVRTCSVRINNIKLAPSSQLPAPVNCSVPARAIDNRGKSRRMPTVKALKRYGEHE